MQNFIAKAVTAMGSAVAVGTGISQSLLTTHSLLSVSLSQFLSGDFTLYVSDIVSIIGAFCALAGLTLTFFRWYTERRQQK